MAERPIVVKIDDHALPTDERVRPLLADAGVELIEAPSPTEDAIIANAAQADVLAVIKEPITERVLRSLPRLRLVMKLGIGVNTIDLAAAARHGVQVANVPDANHIEVGSHAVALLLSLVRALPTFDRDVRRGVWSASTSGHGLHRIDTLTVGVIGMGRTGAYVAHAAGALSMRVVGHDPFMSDDAIRERGAEPVTLDRLLEVSDVVSLHIPLTDETRHLMSHERFAAMKHGSYLVNIARGALVDEAALLDALDSGRLRGAGLDAFETEPLPAGHPLLSSERVILSPHAAYFSVESIWEAQKRGFAQIISFLRGEGVAFPVNTPEVPR